MSKILISETEKNHILNLYDLDTNDNLLIERRGLKRVARDLIKRFKGQGHDGMIFTSDAIKKVVNNQEGYVFDSNTPGSRKLVYLEGEDFINQLERTISNMDAAAMHMFMRNNDPTYMSEYVFNVLIPKYQKADDTTRTSIEALLDGLLDKYLTTNEHIGTGGYPRIQGQLERVLNTIQSDEFKNAQNKSAKIRMLNGTIPDVDGRLGNFIDNIPGFAKELRQTARFLADRKKTYIQVQQDLDRLIRNSSDESSSKDAQKILEKLNVLEVKQNNAANQFYKKIMKSKDIPAELKVSLKELVEARGVQAVWDIGSESKPGGILHSMFEDVTETGRVIGMLRSKKTFWEGIRRAISNMLAYGINGNLATFRSLNRKIIQSSSGKKGTLLTLLRTAFTTFTAPLMASAIIYLLDIMKLLGQSAGFDVDRLWKTEEGSWASWASGVIWNQFSSASEGGILSYMPVLRGPLTKFFLCYYNGGGPECVRGAIDGITEESIENAESSVVGYQDTEQSFESYLRDKNIIYSKVGKGDDAGTYWHRNRGGGTPGSGQKYWWVFNGTDFICDNDEFNN